MNLIFDTNVLVAAFSTHGICNSLFEYALENCTIVISNHILNELHNVLIDKFKVPDKIVSDIIEYLNESCLISDYQIFADQVSRDTKDDPVLGIIDKGDIDYLISGDNDLLILKMYKNVPIISPREMWNIFREPD